METMSATATRERRNTRAKWPIVFVIVVVLFFGLATFGKNFLMNRQASSEYQSVFLENGQVYFGKLEFAGAWIKLTDVYYLQVTDPLQATGDNVIPQKEQNIQLIKLGAELHGPKDEMFISKSKVMFWENMKDGAKVLQSIKDYKLKTLEEKK